MGTHNRITKEKFAEIKGKVKEPKDDVAIAEELGVGESTVRNVRLSKDYQAYCERVFRFHGNPGKRNKRVVKPKVVEYKPSKEAWERLELTDDGPENMRIWALMVLFPVIISFLLVVGIIIYLIVRLIHG